MDWIFQTLTWYAYLLGIGLMFFPLARKLFPQFLDQGYGAAKTIGIIVLTYLSFFLGILHLSTFSQMNLLLILILCGVGNILTFNTTRHSSVKKIIPFILLEEALFLIALFFLAYVRGQEPSIHGLEKFMDFGFMNSILRSTYFPPLDMWYAGSSINYYYFGHLSGALLIKLSGIAPGVGYNLILTTILAQAITISFSLIISILSFLQKQIADKVSRYVTIMYGILGSLVVNLTGNLHTIYLFTAGYPNEKPVPFWEILSTYNPAKYWYPNATRFIPYTIHEFPSYSYVVADLHGHVFDIPFVLLTLALIFSIFVQQRSEIRHLRSVLPYVVLLGFMTAVHYMTNALDGPIYLVLTVICLLLLYRLTRTFFAASGVLLATFIFFTLPFSLFFKPFVTGIGVNCSPDFLVALKKIGPFLFESGNCQVSAPWMLFVLWGFFWSSFAVFGGMLMTKLRKTLTTVDEFILILFALGTALIVIPEFFYVKDIYPLHFRANTMFKLGYQAFIMMSIASTYVVYRLRAMSPSFRFWGKVMFTILFFFIFIYPFFSFPSYYGSLKRQPQLDGTVWLETSLPEDKEIIDWLNQHITGQPVVLEAQGDSYTDFERVSAYTGLPTVAGWWVHEWLWRGSAQVVGERIPDIISIYESSDIKETRRLLRKYNVKYVVVSSQEKTRYQKLDEKKFSQIGTKIFTSTNSRGALYQLN